MNGIAANSRMVIGKPDGISIFIPANAANFGMADVNLPKARIYS
jgi:hypothetical protein